MLICRMLRALLISLLLVCVISGCALCEGSKFSHLTSNSIMPFLAVSQLSLRGNEDASRQAMKALAATSLATQFIKVAVGEKRPNTNSKTSFPSGHTSSAFAMATVVSNYRPELRVPAYAAATLIGVSRIDTGAHHWWDVVAGAALGYCTAKHFCEKNEAGSDNIIGYAWKM